MENSFFNKAVSWEERERIVAEKVREFDKLGEFAHLVAGSNVEFANTIREAIPLAPLPEIPPARKLTPSETAENDGAMIFEQIFGHAPSNTNDLPPAFAAMAEAQREAEFQKLVGPGRAARKKSQDLIDQIVERVLAKSATQREVSSEHNRDHLAVPNGSFMSRLAARAREVATEENDQATSLLAKMLTAHASGDKAGMRQAIRQMIAADAA